MLKRYVPLLIVMLCAPLYGRAACVGLGDPAPVFEARTTQGEISFPEEYKGKWVILFSHPADFTPVCETEFGKFAQMVPEFDRLNTQLIGLSTDSQYMHKAWERTLRKKGTKITFPIISDESTEIAQKYHMIHPALSNHETVRAVTIIDPKGIIRAQLFYPPTTGRNFNEIKRLVEALQITDEKHVLTPANWQPGDKPIEMSKKQAA